jgi:hypothetical protein
MARNGHFSTPRPDPMSASFKLVRFGDRDAGGVVHAADNRGVVARAGVRGWEQKSGTKNANRAASFDESVIPVWVMP